MVRKQLLMLAANLSQMSGSTRKYWMRVAAKLVAKYYRIPLAMDTFLLVCALDPALDAPPAIPCLMQYPLRQSTAANTVVHFFHHGTNWSSTQRGSVECHLIFAYTRVDDAFLQSSTSMNKLFNLVQVARPAGHSATTPPDARPKLLLVGQGLQPFGASQLSQSNFHGTCVWTAPGPQAGQDSSTRILWKLATCLASGHQGLIAALFMTAKVVLTTSSSGRTPASPDASHHWAGQF